MTENDKTLLQEAMRMEHTSGWAEVAELEEKAEAKTARKKIHSIVVRLYHKEEARCGML